MFHKLHPELLTETEWDDILDTVALIIGACQISEHFWLYTPMLDFYTDAFIASLSQRLTEGKRSKDEINECVSYVQAISGLGEGCLLFSSITCHAEVSLPGLSFTT